MEYAHKVLKETLIKELEEARSHSKRNDDGGWLTFSANGLKPALQDDYFMAEKQDGSGYIGFGSDDFTSADIITLLDMGPHLVTKELVLKVVELYFELEDAAAKAKD